jgi:hypothetical protein
METRVEQAVRFAEAGFDTVKIRAVAEPMRNVALVEQTLDALPAGVDLALDAVQGSAGDPWPVKDAIRLGRALEPHADRIAWYEEPCRAENLDGFARVRDAVLKQCDGKDGVEDGFLTDPRQCDFDPATLQCGKGEDGDCLSMQQVEALKAMYQGPRNPRTGAQIYPGLEPGGEGPQPGNPGWSMIMSGDAPFFLAHELLRRGVFGNPDYDWRSFDFHQDVQHANRKLGHVLNAVDPDLRDYAGDGSKQKTHKVESVNRRGGPSGIASWADVTTRASET